MVEDGGLKNGKVVKVVKVSIIALPYVFLRQLKHTNVH